MKQKILCTILVLAMMLSCLPVLAFDQTTNYSGLGTIFHSEDYQLADGLTLSTISAAGSINGNQKAQLITFDPNSDVGLKVSFGKYVYGASSLSSMAKAEEELGKQVLYAINGGYFSYQTGIPLGMMINNGIIQCSDAGQNALCINNDGSYIFGTPKVTTVLTNGAEQIVIDHINKYSSAFGTYLLTDEFATSTKSNAPSLEIVLRIHSGAFIHNGTVNATVEKILTNVTDTKIEAGTMVISTSGTYVEKFKNLTVGANVNIATTLSAGYENVVTAIGGGDIIVKDGKAGQFTQDSLLDVTNPVSVVGVLPSGKFVFMQVDGRQSGYSKGMTAKQVSETMIQLGCVYAMNLDGGGPSTSVVTLPGNSKSSLLNQPSNGSESIISNGILFINKNTKTGTLKNYHIYPQNALALKNAVVDYNVKGTDSAHYAVGLSEYPALTVQASKGSFSGYSYKAPSVAGIYPISASLNSVIGNTLVKVTDTVTSITPNISTISMSPGGTATFNLSAYVNNVKAYSNADSFIWKINGDGTSDNSKMLVSNQFGSIDKNGVFTAASNINSGSIIVTASYGNVAVNITVKVAEAKPAILIDNYNSTLPIVKSFEGANATAYKTSFARYGTSALQINYDFTNVDAAGNFYVACGKEIPDDTVAIDLWSSSPSAYAVVADKNGKYHELAYKDIKTNETGYHLLRATLPATLAAPLTLVTPFKMYSNVCAGTVFIDEVRAYFGDFSYKDVNETMWAKDYINEVTYRGIMTGSNESGVLLFRPGVNLTRAEFAAVVSNYLNLNLNDYKDVKLTYADTSEIPAWAVPYVKAVTAEKLFSGSKEADGKIYFNCKNQVKRVEVMTVLSRLLSDVTVVDTPLKFTDNASIPDWATDAVKKIVGLDIIGGYPDGTLMPLKQMTRSEIAKVMASMR